MENKNMYDVSETLPNKMEIATKTEDEDIESEETYSESNDTLPNNTPERIDVKCEIDDDVHMEKFEIKTETDCKLYGPGANSTEGIERVLVSEDLKENGNENHSETQANSYGTLTPTDDCGTYKKPGNKTKDSVPVSVQYLKTICFSSLSLEEKIKIKSAGRPKPNLRLTNITKCKTREYKRNFRIVIYEKNDWLCGCDVTNSLYCFPCLLFNSDEQTEWTKSGVKDLIHLTEKIKKHESSKAHLSGKLSYNLLGKQDIRQQLNSAFRVSIEKHNEQVKRNRYVLSKIIDCIKFCGAFELALRGHDEADNSPNPGIFKGLINFSAALDLALGEQLQQATMFKGTSKDIQNDLLECMLSVCQAHIKKEIAESKFVSMISDETSDISNTFQIVIVLRYTLKNGTPVERFWSFEKPPDYDAAALANCIENVLNYVLKKPEQLISQSYNGASVHGGVQKLIKDKFPFAYYIHCYAHQSNLIMSQAANKNANVRIFFSELSEIGSFFNSPQRVAVLDEVVRSRNREASTVKWNFTSEIVNTVYKNREVLAECMEKIQSTSRQCDAIVRAGALLRLLNDRKFVFWLAVFHRLMPHVDNLYSQLQKKTADYFTIRKAVTEFEKSIKKEENAIHTIGGSNLRKTDERNSHYAWMAQTIEVCNTIISEIQSRFSFIDHVDIANLFTVEQFKTYSSNFPTQYLQAAVRTFPFLDKNKLKTELEIIYRRADFREVSGAAYLLKFLVENNLLVDFSETCSVLYAIVTMPMTTTEPERCFSTLKRIKTFVRSTASQDRLTALAMLSVEKEMIEDIPNFNELVIEELILTKGRQFQLQYKTCLSL